MLKIKIETIEMCRHRQCGAPATHHIGVRFSAPVEAQSAITLLLCQPHAMAAVKAPELILTPQTWDVIEEEFRRAKRPLPERGATKLFIIKGVVPHGRSR